MKILVGDTGFVGSNLMEYMYFDRTYNSRNIAEAYGLKPDILVYAGVRGTKFIANKFPENDKKNIRDAIENITKIAPKKLILISTVDVYDNLDGVDEDHKINPENLHTYGKNRYDLEQWVINHFNNYHILRLPAIYGKNIKKNFIYDLINPIPPYLTIKDIEKVHNEYTEIYQYYKKDGELYKLVNSDKELYSYFENSNYNTLRFTDSEASYQFLNLNQLHKIINEVVDKNILVLNCVTEQIKSNELYKFVFKSSFNNKISDYPINYDIRTKYKLEGFNVCHQSHYLMNKKGVIIDLSNYINKEKEKYEFCITDSRL